MSKTDKLFWKYLVYSVCSISMMLYFYNAEMHIISLIWFGAYIMDVVNINKNISNTHDVEHNIKELEQ